MEASKQGEDWFLQNAGKGTAQSEHLTRHRNEVTDAITTTT